MAPSALLLLLQLAAVTPSQPSLLPLLPPPAPASWTGSF
jgi:hypothetical protein